MERAGLCKALLAPPDRVALQVLNVGAGERGAVGISGKNGKECGKS